MCIENYSLCVVLFFKIAIFTSFRTKYRHIYNHKKSIITDIFTHNLHIDKIFLSHNPTTHHIDIHRMSIQRLTNSIYIYIYKEYTHLYVCSYTIKCMFIHKHFHTCPNIHATQFYTSQTNTNKNHFFFNKERNRRICDLRDFLFSRPPSSETFTNYYYLAKLRAMICFLNSKSQTFSFLLMPFENRNKISLSV